MNLIALSVISLHFAVHILLFLADFLRKRLDFIVRTGLVFSLSSEILSMTSSDSSSSEMVISPGTSFSFRQYCAVVFSETVSLPCF